jgi:PadR family transcriptional regulator, regulatory protein PadR
MPPTVHGEALKGHLDLLVLAALATEPLHGYAIVRRLRGTSGGAFDLSEGTLYPALYRLERGGLMASEWAAVNGRRRRVYRLTAEGVDALRARADDWRRLAGGLDAVLAEVKL